MRFLRVATALFIAALAVTPTIAMIPTATAAPPAPPNRTFTGVCPVITAAQWQLPYSPYSKGKEYSVQVRSYSCSKADKYIRKLVTHKVHGNFPSLVDGGPKGWRCIASRSKSGRAYTGSCSQSKTGFTGPFFGWSI